MYFTVCAANVPFVGNVSQIRFWLIREFNIGTTLSMARCTASACRETFPQHAPTYAAGEGDELFRRYRDIDIQQCRSLRVVAKEKNTGWQKAVP